jgi:hypothetical protein
MTTKNVTSRQLRSFGLLIGGIFALFGVWPALLRKEDPRLWAFALAIALILPAMAYPRILKPVYRVWMALGQMLGWINTRIILGLLFFTIFTLGGAIMRLLKKDPMNRKLEPEAPSYRVPRSRRPVGHMRHQF